MGKAIVGGVITGLVLLAGYVMYYTGYFRPVSLEYKNAGPFVLLGKVHHGAYHKIVPVIMEVETWAKSHGISCRQSAGYYIDDPHATEEPRLKSWGGCILEEQEQKHVLELQSSEGKDFPEDFQIETLPSSLFVVARFAGSAGIGPMKVYPLVDDYVVQHQLHRAAWKVLEVYEVRGKTEMTTTYYFPVSPSSGSSL